MEKKEEDKIIYPDEILVGDEQEQQPFEEVSQPKKTFLQESVYPRLLYAGIFFVNLLIFTTFAIRFVYYSVKSAIFLFKDKKISRQLNGAFALFVASFLTMCITAWGIIKPHQSSPIFFGQDRF